MSDYEEFVKRMGSFDMDLSLDDIGPNKNELKHYGILGMKWGIRRTPEQLARFIGRSTTDELHEDYYKAHTSKSIESMSDAELRNRINRLQMERQYSQLNPSNIDKGKEYIQNIIKAGTTVATATTIAITLYNNVNKIKSIIESKNG